MKRTIAIVAGGDSSEHGVSMKSAEGIYSFIDQDKYTLYIVELTKARWEAILSDGSRAQVDKNDFSFMDHGQKIIPDFAYITIHGTPGENGILQGYFELLGIPYSTCDVLVSALTFSKFTLNQYLKGFGIRVAESMLVNKRHGISDEDVIAKIGLPCFIKPNASGSSFGVTKVKTKEQIQPALEAAFKESDDVMIEAFMDGIELANGCYKTKKNEVVFPITEVVSQNEFFDYNAKYKGEVTEITPARLSPELTSRVQQLTSAIYDILGCKGIVRVDYIITEGEKINMLEINTTPGMTATSFIPHAWESVAPICTATPSRPALPPNRCVIHVPAMTSGMSASGIDSRFPCPACMTSVIPFAAVSLKCRYNQTIPSPASGRNGSNTTTCAERKSVIKSKTRPNTASMAPIAMPRSSADNTYKNVSFAFFFNPCKSCDRFMVFLFFHNPFFVSYMRHMNN